MYEKEFIDHIFLATESFIKKEDFVTAIAGTLSKQGTCSWLFSTTHLRTLFQKNFDFEENIKDII
jgi:hypothetical protein